MSDYEPKTELARLLLALVRDAGSHPGHEGIVFDIDLNEALKQADEVAGSQSIRR